MVKGVYKIFVQRGWEGGYTKENEKCVYHHHCHFIYKSSQKNWAESPEKDNINKKKQKERTEIKTYFDNYKQGTNRNDQRWEDF